MKPEFYPISGIETIAKVALANLSLLKDHCDLLYDDRMGGLPTIGDGNPYTELRGVMLDSIDSLMEAVVEFRKACAGDDK